MKIGIIVPMLSGGGAERVMVTVANELAYKRYNVIIISLSPGGSYLNEVNKNVAVVQLSTSSLHKSIFKILAIIKHEKIKLIITSIAHLNFFAVFIKYLYNKSIYAIIRESNHSSSLSKYQKSLSVLIINNIKGLVYNLADKTISPENFYRRFVNLLNRYQ